MSMIAALMAGYVILTVGDSIMDTNTSPENNFVDTSAHTTKNLAVTGSTIAVWEGFGFSNLVAPQIPTLDTGETVQIVAIMSGANDANNAVTSADYKADLLSFIAQCKADTAGLKYLLLKSGYTTLNDALIDAYAADMNEVCAADAAVFCGWDLRHLDDKYFSDSTHPAERGHDFMRVGFEYYVLQLGL
jgi:lysophospholipase L1-like esterase